MSLVWCEEEGIIALKGVQCPLVLERMCDSVHKNEVSLRHCVSHIRNYRTTVSAPPYILWILAKERECLLCIK